MKKRIVSFALTAGMMFSLLSGCGGGDGSKTDGETAGEEGKVVNIYVWNQEFQEKFNACYPEVEKTSNDLSVTYLKDGTEVHWTINPNQDGVYQQKLDEALANQGSAAADDKIDIFLAEADYVMKYTDPEVGATATMSSLGISREDVPNQYEYTLQAVTGDDGEIRGLSYQATPGMFVYRRSIAKAVLGTDDPDTVYQSVSDWDKFDETAYKMKDAGYYMVSGRADTYRVFSNNVSAPWVDGDKVKVDPNLMNWVEQSKRYTDEGLNHKVGGQWTDEWNKDMSADSKVFGFFLPAWGLGVCIEPNVEGSSAAEDWAACASPQPFYWGGTWLLAAEGTDNPEHVKDILLKMTADTEILKKMAVEDNDMTNDQPLMEELAKSPDFASAILGGQNHLAVLTQVAASIDLGNISPYDQGCTEEFQNVFGDYFNGKIDLEKAKANFETAIVERYPELSGGVEWP
jgi:multiple sugar transport system substrate-binding protein